MNKKNIIRPLMVVLIITSVGIGWWYVHNQAKQDDTHLLLYGNVDIREINLTFNNSEHIDKLLVKEGDRVHEGQLVATLHSARMQAEMEMIKAKVASQNAVLARLERGSRLEEINQARANVDAAKAKLVDAQATFKRTQNLYRENAASKQAEDDARANLKTAQSNLKVAEQTLALAIEGPRIEDIEEAKAVLEMYKAELVLAQEILKDTELFAPADGIIRNRILEPGDMATPQIPVFTLAKNNPVWVRTYAPEKELGKLTLGMSAEVSTDSYPGKTYVGWVGFISPTAEFTPKNVETPELRTRLVYQIRVYVCNPEDELRLGMPATVSIPFDQPKPESGPITPNCEKRGEG